MYHYKRDIEGDLIRIHREEGDSTEADWSDGCSLMPRNVGAASKNCKRTDLLPEGGPDNTMISTYFWPLEL